jgi:hypothetical protein
MDTAAAVPTTPLMKVRRDIMAACFSPVIFALIGDYFKHLRRQGVGGDVLAS